MNLNQLIVSTSYSKNIIKKVMPVEYDVLLSCSSPNELEWITEKAVPQLQYVFYLINKVKKKNNLCKLKKKISLKTCV